MNVSIKPEYELFVEEQVRAGHFSSPSEVVEAALARLMLEALNELDDDDVAAIEEGEEQIARGEVLDWKEVSAQLRKEYLDE